MSLFKEINSENKLRITITYLAMNTLCEDEADFGLGMATLVNRIIAYYSPIANASISVQVSKYAARLKKALGYEENIWQNQNKKNGTQESSKSHNASKEVRDFDENGIIEKLTIAEEQSLISSLPKYKDTPESFLFRVSNDNIFLLTQDPTRHEERYYKKGIKAYVEALVEEFTRLPFVDRERIYCTKVVHTLETAMQTETAVYIFHTFGKKYLMRVFEITTDSLSTHNYIISRLIDTENSKMNNRIYTFRLSRIEKVLEKPGISGAFTDEEKKKTALAVSKSGAQFLGDRISNIVVEFTDEGLKQFASQMHLRPHVKKIRPDGHTYEFECTSTQAIFYFRRLGATAKILKPAFLTREMEKWFHNAAEHYK